MGRGSVLFTTALSERGRHRPICIKCAVWSWTGYQPPYVPTELPNVPEPHATPLQRSA
jgi:hypothetical protein